MGHGFREQPQIVDFMDITVLGRNVAPSIDDVETLLAGLGLKSMALPVSSTEMPLISEQE